MKKIFVVFALVIFCNVSCEEDKKVLVSDDDNNAVDLENQDQGDKVDDVDIADEEDKDEEDKDKVDDVDFVDDENEEQDEATDETQDEAQDEVADEINDADIEDCIGLGETSGSYPGAPECCQGLQSSTIFEIVYENKIGSCQGLVGGIVCINCGNKVCDLGEDLCNCPDDCQEPRDERCDDGSTDVCDMIPPVDCEGSEILAIKNSCWSCVDPTSCEETDRPAHCDDGSIPACYMMPPECEHGEVLAYVDSCYLCLDEETCD